MGASNTQRDSMRYFQLNQKCDEQNTPHFTEKIKVGEFYENKGQYNEFSGRIVSGKLHVGKTKAGMEIRSFRLIFQDGNGRYQLELSHGGLTYNILNCLAFSFDKTKEVKISVYKKEDKRNNVVYHNSRAWITIAPHGQTDSLKWKYQPDEVPRKKEIFLADGTALVQNGKKVLDDKEVKAFWEKVAVTEVFADLSEEVLDNIKRDLRSDMSDFEPYDQQGGSLAKEEGLSSERLPESPNKGSRYDSSLSDDLPF